MSAEELPLSISVQSIADYLSCPICMCDLTDTHMTACGHRFCDACIKESVGRHHKCPCCNKPLQVKDLVRDHQFDTLIATINEEKEKSEKTYFDTLISHASDDSSVHSAAADRITEHVFSPIETVLKKFLKAGLVSHQKYYQQLTTQYEKRIAQTRAEYERLKNDLHRQSLMEEELERQEADLQSTHERQVKTLQDELDNCVTMIADAFDSYLKDHVPSLSVLPVKVSVNILSKNIQIPDVILKPHDGLEVLKNIIEENMERRGDKIVMYGEDAKFICFGPFTKRSLYEMNQMAFDLVNHSAANPDVFILPDQSRPVLQFSLKPGSEVALYGTVQCQSDLPKYCFASTFQKGEAQTVDYFTCKTCNMNWVCRPCMEKCHKVHSIQPYILNHQPTWACCYCPKKKKCVNQPT